MSIKKLIIALTISFLPAMCCVAQGEDEKKEQMVQAFRTFSSLTEEGKREESLAYAEKAWLLSEEVYSDESETKFNLAFNYAINLADVEEYEKSHRQFLRAIEIYEKTHGKTSLENIQLYFYAGTVSANLKNVQEAKQEFLAGLKVAEHVYGLGARDYARYELEAGKQLLVAADSKEAGEFLLAAYTMFSEGAGLEDLDTAYSAFYLGSYYQLKANPRFASDRIEKAEELYLQALPVLERHKDETAGSRLLLHRGLAIIYISKDDMDKALIQLQAAGKILEYYPVVENQPFYKVDPDYSPTNQASQSESRVVLELNVDMKGFVEDIKVIESDGDPEFQKAAIEAVNRWRYPPKYMDGKPTEVTDIIVTLKSANNSIEN